MQIFVSTFPLPEFIMFDECCDCQNLSLFIMQVLHSLKIPTISLTLDVFHAVNSGKDVKDLHPKNISFKDCK